MTILKKSRIVTKWYDLLDDNSISGTYWSQTSGNGTSLSTEDSHMISLYTKNGGWNSNASKTLTTKIDLKTLGNIFRFQAFGFASGTGGSSGASVGITDGSNFTTLAICAATGTSTISAWGITVVLTVSEDGNTVNFKRTGWVKYLVAGASASIISNNTNIDITGWSKLQIQLNASQCYSTTSAGRGLAAIDKIEYEIIE